jgi:3-hydroxyacyl-CoA dehydrogenase
MTAINPVVDLTPEGEVAVITVNSPPVNALSAAVRDGIREALERATADAAVKAVVIACAGRTFIAGADIREFGKPPQGIPLPELCEIIENSAKPVVAAIHGTALGGGLEVALACHYRVAVPSAKCGLPEVKLGLIPGAGGTQRLPRIVGVERALEMITSGEHVGAKAAHEMGLVDALAPEGSLRETAVSVAGEGKPPRRVRDMNDKLEAARGRPEIFAEFRKANARKFRGFEAPEACIKAIEAAVTLPFDEGMKRERELFRGLVTGTQSAASAISSSPSAKSPRSRTCRRIRRRSRSGRSASSGPGRWAAASR